MIIYKCDRARDGVLCCVFESFLKKEQPVAVYSCDFQPMLGATVKDIKTEDEKAQRVRNALIKSGGIGLLSELFLPLRSFDETRETVIFNVAKRCINEKRNVLTDYTDPNVLSHYDMTKKIRNEVHRMHGFIRFSECFGGLYAHFEPDNDIIDLVAPHFAKRFSSERFILHDTKRNLLTFYDGKSIKTTKASGAVTVHLTEDEEKFRSLWKTYFHSVAIETRKNTRLQDGYLPRRYRKNINEFL